MPTRVFLCSSLQDWKHFFAISSDATSLTRLSIMIAFSWYETNYEGVFI